MSRARLQKRVGNVLDLGWSTLENYEHGFTKRTREGKGAGNIRPCSNVKVHGVLYQLSKNQLNTLDSYEYDYNRHYITLMQNRPNKQVIHDVCSYMAPEWHENLLVPESYWEHYQEGMQGHDFPLEYQEFVAKQARREHCQLRKS